jgi:hypothetical protein
VIATAAAASAATPGVTSARNAAVFRAVFAPMLSTFRKKMGTPDALQQSGQNPDVEATPGAIAHLGNGPPAV